MAKESPQLPANEHTENSPSIPASPAEKTPPTPTPPSSPGIGETVKRKWPNGGGIIIG